MAADLNYSWLSNYIVHCMQKVESQHTRVGLQFKRCSSLDSVLNLIHRSFLIITCILFALCLFAARLAFKCFSALNSAGRRSTWIPSTMSWEISCMIDIWHGPIAFHKVSFSGQETHQEMRYPNVTSLCFATPLACNATDRGVLWDDLRKILHGGQRVDGSKWRRNIAESFNPLSRAHERCRRQTDRRQTDLR